jgi:hypothetical protein
MRAHKRQLAATLLSRCTKPLERTQKNNGSDMLDSQLEWNSAVVSDVGLQALDSRYATAQPFHARFQVSSQRSIWQPPLHEAAQFGQGRNGVPTLLHRQGEVVAEPLPPDVHASHVKLQLLQLEVEFSAVEAEGGLHNV